MAFLTSAERASLVDIIRNLSVGSAGKFLDARSVERLTRIFGDKCNFVCPCSPSPNPSFLQGMRDEPFVTLLNTLLCADAAGGSLVNIGASLSVEELQNLLDTACPPTVDLGAAQLFSVLGATTVINSGNTVVDADLGISPGGALVGFPPGIVLGSEHLADAAAAAAQVSAGVAYDQLTAMGSGTVLAGNIGGMTLGPGVYSSASTLAISSGDLFLDAGGDPCASFYFNIGTALTTTTSRKVILLNGALARNVFWRLGSAATLGANSIMRGTLIANTSITVVTEAYVEGRVFARTGQVSLDTNVISLPV